MRFFHPTFVLAQFFIPPSSSEAGQILMRELYRYRAFSNRRSRALYRAVPDVSSDKNAGNAGFEQKRSALLFPNRGKLARRLRSRNPPNLAGRIGTGEVGSG